jgi:amidase
MSDQVESWKLIAEKKVSSNKAKIPEDWRLKPNDIEKAAGLRDLTDGFIDQFLNDEEKAIVNLSSVAIVDSIRSTKYSSVQVTKAFCKTAAIASQIVCSLSFISRTIPSSFIVSFPSIASQF